MTVFPGTPRQVDDGRPAEDADEEWFTNWGLGFRVEGFREGTGSADLIR